MTEIIPSLESGVADDIIHPGRHQLAGGVAQPSRWVQPGAVAVTPTAGGLFLQEPITMSFAVQSTEAVGLGKPLDLTKGANIGRVHL